ncbi:MAG: phage tail tape measure protein [Thermoleophilia bacterium]|nr:phage tail tape measure protein [Thermoleophilia bacterium]
MSPRGGKTFDLLTVKIGAEYDEALKAFDGVEARAKAMTEGFMAAGAAAAAVGTALVAAAVSAGDYADELLDLQDQTGLTTTELQQFRAVAIQAGVGPDTIAEAVQKLQVRMAQGAEGSADLRFALKELGLELENVDGTSRAMGDVVREAIGKLGDMEDVTKRNVLAVRLFGRGATELLPVLSLTSSEIDGVIERAERLGLVMSEDALDAANDFRVEWDLMKASLAAGSREIGVAVIPMLVEFVRLVNDTVVPALRNWADEWRRILASQGGGPSAAAQGIIEGFGTIDDLAALQSRYMMFFDMLPNVASAAGKSINEIQADFEELGITATDLTHILLALEERIANVPAAAASGAGGGATVVIPELTERVVALQLSTASLVGTLHELPVALEGIGAPAEEAVEDMERLDEGQSIMVSALSSGLADAALDARNFGEVIHRMAQGIIRDLIRVAIQAALTRAILGTATGGVGFLGGVPGRAAGGPVTGGRPYMVGESGPELFVPSTAGRIVASAPTAASSESFASSILERLGPMPQAMTPDAVAAHRWYRQLFEAQVRYGRHDGVRI